MTDVLAHPGQGTHTPLATEQEARDLLAKHPAVAALGYGWDDAT